MILPSDAELEAAVQTFLDIALRDFDPEDRAEAEVEMLKRIGGSREKLKEDFKTGVKNGYSLSDQLDIVNQYSSGLGNLQHIMRKQ